VIGTPQILVLLVALQRLAELFVARRNTARLMARGGREHGRRHYPLFMLLHAGWLIAIFLLVPPDVPTMWPLLALYLLLQPLRVWIIASLGGRWTTRIVTLPESAPESAQGAAPDAGLVASGPYHLLRHPNYLLVVVEIALLPLAFGAWQIALAFSLLNAALLRHRIAVEETALGLRSQTNRP